MNQKIIIPLLIIILSCLFLILFSSQALMLCSALILLAIIKHKIYPIKKELLWYLLVGFGGAFAEIILVNSGSTWQYLTEHFFGIPIWIPFFWGVLGTTIIVLHEGFNKKEKK